MRILAIEDDVADGRMLRYAMQGAVDFRARVTIVRDLATAISTLGQWTFDLVLVDLNLPDSSGLVTLHRLRAAAPDQAIVIVTGVDDLEIATEGIKSGALDFIVKGQMSGHFLVRAFQYALERHRLERELRANQGRALRVSSETLAAVSRELNAPLTTLVDLVDLLDDEATGELSARQREIVDALARNVDRLKRVSSEVLEPTWTSKDAVRIRPQPIALRALVETVVGETLPTAARSGVEISIDVADDFDVVTLADRVRMRQAVADLLRRAVQFAAPGTQVRVRPRVTDGRVEIGVVEPRPFVAGGDVTSLIDDVMREQGAMSALWLDEARRIASAHCGLLRILDAEPGTEVVVRLPVQGLRELVEPVQALANQHDHDLCRARVRLTADDPQLWTERRLDDVHFAVQQCLVPGLDLALPLAEGPSSGSICIPCVLHVVGGHAETLVDRMVAAVQRTLRELDVHVETSIDVISRSDDPTGRLDALEQLLAEDCPWTESIRA